MGAELAHAHRLHRRQVGIQLAGQQDADFLERAGVRHGPEAGVAAGVERRARRLQHHCPVIPGDRRRGVRLPVGQGPAGGGVDLQGARQPLPVARRDAGLGGGIGSGEL